jgi:hypothetical protein
VARLRVVVAAARPATGVGGAGAEEADASEDGYDDDGVVEFAHVISEERLDAISNCSVWCDYWRLM